jgi:hypothetical protein
MGKGAEVKRLRECGAACLWLGSSGGGDRTAEGLYERVDVSRAVPAKKNRRGSGGFGRRSNVEAEIDNVAIFDRVGFSLQPDDPHLASRGVIAGSLQIVKGDHLSSNEPPLDV